MTTAYWESTRERGDKITLQDIRNIVRAVQWINNGGGTVDRVRYDQPNAGFWFDVVLPASVSDLDQST